MVEFMESVEPIVIAVLTVFITALITVTAKFAPSEAGAIFGFKNLGARIFYYCWALWLLYTLTKEVISPEPVTRVAVFLIAIYTISIGLYFIFFLLKDITKILNRIIELHSQHQGVTDVLIKLHESAQKSAINGNSKGVTNLVDD
jgi:ABC-type transport system involved in multi-copper enzyme maturation permease subunit